MWDLDTESDAKPAVDSRGFRELKLSHEPDLPEILRCVVGLSNPQIRTYLAVLRNQNSGIESIAAELDRSENTVREHLNVLADDGLVNRDAQILENRRSYLYQAMPESHAKPTLRKVIKNWIGHVYHRIDNLQENPTGTPIIHRSGAATASTATSDTSAPATPTTSTSTDTDTDTDADMDTRAMAVHQILDGKQPSLRSISTCVFGLSGPLMKLYLTLLDHPSSTTKDLAEIEDYARSTFSARLNDLQDRGLARPVGREVATGNGMAVEYLPRPFDEVRREMKDQLQGDWTIHANDCIEEFDFSSVDYS